MIGFDRVSQRFGTHTVVENLTYAFPATGLFALMGPSGIGKTTLLRLLSGALTPSEGRVYTPARPVSFVFQEPRLIPHLTCEKNINFVLSKEKKRLNTAQKWLEALEVGDCKDTLPDALSGGQRARVSLARALAADDATMLLLDEPFAALDKDLRARIFPYIKGAARDRLVLLVTHDQSDASALGATLLFPVGDPITALANTTCQTEQNVIQ